MKKGFTLIELLVVIAVIGLIASVALANLQDARRKAREAAGKQFHSSVRHSLGDKIVSSWELEESTGSSYGPGGEPEGEARDNSGNGMNGTIVGAEHVAVGISGSALYFDGSDYVWGENFVNPGVQGNFTIDAWIKPDIITGQHTIFSLPTTDSCTGFEVKISNGKANVNGTDTTGFVLANNAWQNLVVSFRTDPTNGPTVDTYLNGDRVGSTVGLATGNCPNGHWSIGATVDSSEGAPGESTNGFVGLIDSVNIYQEHL